jgi:hypothetical protein
LVSGEKQPLFTNFYFAQLQEIRDPYCYIFHADGTVSEYDAKDFPLLIECSRVEEGAPFKSEFKARYLRVDEETEFGRRSHILILDVKVTVQGIEISFGPMKGHEDMFYADFVDIPVTKTSYKKEKNQFTISFMNTAISESVTLDNGHIEGQNMFIKSANLVSDDGSCRLIIDLADSVRYYRGFRKELNSGIPYALFTFHFEEDVLEFGPDPAFQ